MNLAEHLDNSLQTEPSSTQTTDIVCEKDNFNLSLTHTYTHSDIQLRSFHRMSRLKQSTKCFAKRYWLDKELLDIQINYQGPLV
jgi:hypothetical protein